MNDDLDTRTASQQVAQFRGRCVWCSQPYASGDTITAYTTTREHGPEFDGGHVACHRLIEAFHADSCEGDFVPLGRATQEIISEMPHLLDDLAPEDAAWLRARFEGDKS